MVAAVSRIPGQGGETVHTCRCAAASGARPAQRTSDAQGLGLSHSAPSVMRHAMVDSDEGSLGASALETIAAAGRPLPQHVVRWADCCETHGCARDPPHLEPLQAVLHRPGPAVRPCRLLVGRPAPRAAASSPPPPPPRRVLAASPCLLCLNPIAHSSGDVLFYECYIRVLVYYRASWVYDKATESL